MRYGYIARSMTQGPLNALALRHRNLFRLCVVRGCSIATVYSRPPWLLDFEFASNMLDDDFHKRDHATIMPWSAF
jgi:hypothetical protein